jgi:hypothetical protein
MKALYTVVAILAVMATSCKGPMASPRDLVGEWVMTTESLRHLPISFAKKSMTMTLAADGTFSVQELPGELVSLHETEREMHLSGRGKWKIVLQDGRQELQLEFEDNSTGPKVPFPLVPLLTIGSEGTNFVLFFYHGDFYTMWRMDFKRVK